MRTLIASLTTLLSCGLCHAAMTPDPTGMWYDPAESGWGMTLAQQGDTMFAVLFVYDDAHRPAWYVASDIVLLGTDFSPFPGGSFFGGTLYRTSGPWFGGPFDPHAVGTTAVGRIQLGYAAAGPGRALGVTYTIDGVQVAKTLQPQTWGDNLPVLTRGGSSPNIGTYAGGPVITAKSPDTCPDFTFIPPFQKTFPFTFSVSTAGADSGQVFVGWGTGSDTACTLHGTYSQGGQLGAISGPFQCGPLGFTPRPDDPTIDITGIVASPDGFSGALTVHAAACTYTGHIGGVRVP